MSYTRPSSRAMLQSRIGTAQREVTFEGVGMNTSVNVSAAAVTGEGLSGARSSRGIKSAGPRRQVQDPTYYLGLLREKNAELLNEIEKFKTEKQEFEKDTKLYAQYERRYETLIREVREFEGQLADLNLAHDKHRSGTNPLEIMRFQKHVREHNESQAREVDSIFIQVQEREKATHDIKEQIQSLHDKTKEKIATLDTEKAAKYTTLLETNEKLKDRLRTGQMQVDEMSVQIRRLEEEIQNNTWRNEVTQGNKRLARLHKEAENLEAEVESMSMDPKQARQLLLAKVQSTNQEIRELKLQSDVLQDNNSQARATLAELQKDIEDRKGDSNDSQKYEVLFKRDKEMSDFIDKFPEDKEKELTTQAGSQEMIVGLLNHISQDLMRQHELPTEAKVIAMRDDLSFKKRQVDASETTHQRLQAELQKRQNELEKINGLDKKITVELKSLNEKMVQMKKELPELGNVDGLERRAEATTKKLTALKQQYQQRCNSAMQQNAPLTQKYEKLNAKVKKSETGKKLLQLEKKMKKYEQKIFDLAEYIESKGTETDYTPIRDGCMRLVADINAIHVKAAEAGAGL